MGKACVCLPSGWVGQSTALLEPLAEAIGRHVKAGRALFADDTLVPMQRPAGPWCSAPARYGPWSTATALHGHAGFSATAAAPTAPVGPHAPAEAATGATQSDDARAGAQGRPMMGTMPQQARGRPSDGHAGQGVGDVPDTRKKGKPPPGERG